MQLIPIIAIGISVLSLAVTIITSVKTFRKSKRLEFFQRRDQLYTKISELNNRLSEIHLLQAQLEIVNLKKRSLKLTKDQTEVNIAQIKSINKIADNLEAARPQELDVITQLHILCSTLTPSDDANVVEKLIALVQERSDGTATLTHTLSAFLQVTAEPTSILSFDIESAEIQIQSSEPELIKTMKRLRGQKSPPVKGG